MRENFSIFLIFFTRFFLEKRGGVNSVGKGGGSWKEGRVGGLSLTAGLLVGPSWAWFFVSLRQ